MKTISFRQIVSAGGQAVVEKDLSTISRYLLWAYVFGAQRMEIRRRNTLIASSRSPIGFQYTPEGICYVFENTDDPLEFTLHNYGGSDVTATITLVMDDSAYSDLIDKDFHLRTRTWGEPTWTSWQYRSILDNTKRGIDYVTIMLKSTQMVIQELYSPSSEEIIDAEGTFDFYNPQLPLPVRISEGEQIEGLVEVISPAPTGACGEVVFWELPAGADAPPFPPPANPSPPQPVPVPSIPVTPSPPTPPGTPPPTTPFPPPIFPPFFPVPHWPPTTPPAPPSALEGEQSSLLPYPPSLDEILQLTPPIPEASHCDIPRDVTNLPFRMRNLPWKDIPGLLSLVGIGPFGVHLLRMDSMGRIRHTDQAVLYNAGKVEKTDTSTTTITPDRLGSRVSLKAADLGWEIKILTIYDLLLGKDFTSADIIYLDAGDSFDESIEAAQIQVSCPDATTTNPGKLYYYVGV